jgi:CBS domain-containing protein
MLPDMTVLEAKRYGVFSCSMDTTIGEATSTMVKEDISGLVVVDDQGYLRGIITRTDLLKASISGMNAFAKPIDKYMSSAVITVTPTDSLNTVARLLIEQNIHRVVIVQPEGNNMRPVGVISDADLIYHISKSNLE